MSRHVKKPYVGLITILYKERFIDKITNFCGKRKIIKPLDHVYLYDEKDMFYGAFVSVKGPKLIVKFLERFTDINEEDTEEWDIGTLPTGKIDMSNVMDRMR